jgi:DNA ligase-1
MNFVEVLKECEQASGGGSKLIIRQALAKLDTVSRRLFWLAQNPYLVYGVRKFAQPTKFAEVDGDVTAFYEMFDKLNARELTGNAARDAVTNFLSNFTKETAHYLERIIEKNLDAGFSADTYNLVLLARGENEKNGTPFEDALKTIDKKLKTGSYVQFVDNAYHDDLVPLFSVMLADKCDEPEDFEYNVQFPCQADFKYDGERTIAIVKADGITYHSRSGKEASHVDGLFDEDLMKVREHLGYDFILDGERCSDLGFTDTVNAKKEGNDEAKANLRFRAFFIMPLTDWIARSTMITMREVRTTLDFLISTLGLKKIILTEGREVKDYDDMADFCNEAIDKPENAARKIEGLILKNWNATYQWDRTFDWCKVKRFYDVDCRIVGFEPGRKKSKYEHTTGKLLVIGFLENGTRVEARAGSGLREKRRDGDDAPTRDELWNNQAEWLGKTVVIKYQEVSMAKGAEVASLRFPTVFRFRDDKIVEV